MSVDNVLELLLCVLSQTSEAAKRKEWDMRRCKQNAASSVFHSRTWDCYISPLYLLQEELGALVMTEDRHGNVSMQWRFITLMETFGGMDPRCLLPSSPYEPTPAVQAVWKGSCTSVEDFMEQVLK